MNSIIGIYKRNISVEDISFEFFEYDAEDVYSQRDVWHQKDVVIAQEISGSLAEIERERKNKTDGHFLHIIGDSRLDYVDELLKKIGDNGIKLIEQTDKELIILAYEKWGPDCLDHLEGEYSFGIWDERTESFFCARDRIGIVPFYYFVDDEHFAFSNDLINLVNYLKDNLIVSEDWIANLLIVKSPSKRDTPYKSVYKLPPGSFLTFVNSKLNIQEYWSMPSDKIKNNIDKKKALRELYRKIEESVSSKIRNEDSVGAELSGGLDSAGIVGVASEILKVREAQLDAYSHVLDSKLRGTIFPFDDESDKSKIVADKYNCRLNQISDVELGIMDAISNMIKTYGGVGFFNFAMFSESLYKRVLHNGNKILLSGYGGDQGVSFNPKTLIYDYSRRRLYKSLWKYLKNKNQTKSVSLFTEYLILIILPKLHNYLRQRKRIKQTQKKNNYFPISQNFKSKSSDFKKYSLKNKVPFCNDIYKEQLKLIKADSLVNRLETSYVAAKRKMIRYVYPYLDVDC